MQAVHHLEDSVVGASADLVTGIKNATADFGNKAVGASVCPAHWTCPHRT